MNQSLKPPLAAHFDGKCENVCNLTFPKNNVPAVL